MSAHIQTLLLAITIGFVYWWLHTPALSYFTLQVFALSVALYFVLKRMSKSKLWHIAPAAQSFEMILATFAFLLIIGYTGNLDSVIFPLTYIHLFFLVFSTQTSTSITTSLFLAVFHYALGGSSQTQLISALLTIPVLVVLFLFTKNQYEGLQKEKRINQGEEIALTNSLNEQHQLVNLLSNFIQPKLVQIKDMSLNAEKNRSAIMGQILIMQMEISKFLQKSRNDE